MGLPVIFSKAFIKRFFYKLGFNKHFDDYFSKRMRTQKVFYNIYSKEYQDVRDCFKTTDEQRQEMSEYFNNLVKRIEMNDEKALYVAKHLTSKFKYEYDDVLYSVPEYWAPPYMTFKKILAGEKCGDCDDLANLTVYAWGLIGIPAGRRYTRAGDVNNLHGEYAGGHATAVYWSEEYNRLFALEGTFNAPNSYINYRKTPIEDNNIYKGRHWFWTNEKYSYKGDDTLKPWMKKK